MLRDDYPIYFDTDEITIKHRQWNRQYQKLTSIATTEAGTDDVEVVRFAKCVIAAQFRCTDTWAGFFASYNDHQEISVKFYDTDTDAYVTKNMRMQNLQINEIAGSDRLTVTEGVYNVAFQLVEF